MGRYKAAIRAALVLAVAAGLQAQTQLDLGRQGKNVDFSGAIKTKPLKSGTSLPAKCEPGEMFHKADAPAGMNIFVCGPQDTWGMVGKELPSAGMQAGRVLAAGQQSVEWKALGGDAAGTIEALRVRGLQGRSVSEAMPSEGDVLSWSGALGAWTPAPPQGQYEAGLGVAIAGRAIAVDDATVPRYSTGVGAPSGPCIPGRDWYVDLGGQQLYFCSAVNRWQGTGHTNWGMIGGNLSNQADLWSALGGKADAVHTHNAGGDVTGELSALTVSRIQNRAVSAATPADGQVLIWDAAGGQWRPGTIAGSSGWDPLDPATLVLREEFCSGGTTSGQIGALGWATSTIQGTALSNSYTIGSSVRPCELRGIGVSSTNPNDGKSLYLILSATAPFHNAASSGNWEAVFIWQYPTNASDLRSRVGLVKFDEPNVLVPSAFLGVRIDTDSAWEPTGSTFIACVCNGSSKSNCTDQDTGVSVTPDTWYKLTIWSDAAGVIRMRVNEGNVITFNNPPTLPGSTVDFQPAWIVGRTGGTGNRQASVDFFAGRVKGLAR